MKSRAKTAEQYLRQLPTDRRKAISAVRKGILKNLPHGYEEFMNWGMITYAIPLKSYPNTYNNQPLCYAALASQKNHMAVYLTNVYGDKPTERWFRQSYKAAGKRLDMGKSCVRFRKLEDLPLDVISKAVSRTSVKAYIRHYEKYHKP